MAGMHMNDVLKTHDFTVAWCIIATRFSAINKLRWFNTRDGANSHYFARVFCASHHLTLYNVDRKR
jgi:hypothetical protein